tara:strand:+ start:130 stop:597 length:468 start_codon:yes stop_codon:yes gene_type:complete
MTVQDSSNYLFEWFEKHDSFEMTKDLKNMIPIMENQEADTVSVRLALESLEEAGLIASKEYADKKYYILSKPVDAFQQSIEVGPYIAKFISHEINEFCLLIDDKTDSCQTSSISEKDIKNLVHIAQFYKQKVMEKETLLSDNSGLLEDDGVEKDD